jgi:hypothetical protein
MREHKIPGSRTAVQITFKKTLRAGEQERTDVARARRRRMREQGLFDLARLVFIDETSANTDGAGLQSLPPRRAGMLGRLALKEARMELR